MKLRNVIRDMQMPFTTYLILVVASVMVFGLIVPMLVGILFQDLFTGITGILLVVVPAFAIVSVASLPLVFSSKEKQEIEKNMPLFVTRMAALATSELPVDRIFEILSERAEYGRLAKDSGRIHRLISEYHVGAAQACRIVAQRSPSDIETDFLLRLAHALEVGERLERFLRNEQDVTMDEYVLRCDAVLKDMDFLKGIFASVITAMIFLGVFVAIIPILTADSVETLTAGVILIFLLVEVMFLYMVAAKVPKDDIWYRWRDKMRTGMFTRTDRRLLFSIIIVFAILVGMAIIMVPMGLPLPLLLSSICLPILIPGIMFAREERRIVRRDSIYGAFIRALGRSSEVSGQTMAKSIRILALQKFGPLTRMIKNLSKRLAIRIDALKAWSYFSAESESNLINKFSEMYVHGTLNGAKPEPTSVFISNNMVKMMGIRTKRNILASSFTGVLYGIMIALAITMWITVEIIAFMGRMAEGLLSSSETMELGILENMFSASASLETIRALILVMVFMHALFSALMLTKLRGGHPMVGMMHFVVLVWIGCLSSYLVETLMAGML